MSPEKQIRSQIETRILAKCPQIAAKDLVSFFENRSFDVSGAAVDEDLTYAGRVVGEVRVLITTSTKTDLDLFKVFFDWLRLPNVEIDLGNNCKLIAEVRLDRSVCDLEKDHYKQENLYFEVKYHVAQLNEPYEITDTDIQEMDWDGRVL